MLPGTSPKLLLGQVKRGVPSGYVVKRPLSGSRISPAGPVPITAQSEPYFLRIFSTISPQVRPSIPGTGNMRTASPSI